LHAGANALPNYYPVGGVAGATTALGLGRLLGTLTVAAGPSSLARRSEPTVHLANAFGGDAQ